MILHAVPDPRFKHYSDPWEEFQYAVDLDSAGKYWMFWTPDDGTQTITFEVQLFSLSYFLHFLRSHPFVLVIPHSATWGRSWGSEMYIIKLLFYSYVGRVQFDFVQLFYSFIDLSNRTALITTSV